MSPTDHFSKQASSYAKFRPTYPVALFEVLYQKIKGRKLAWDCATGNGQVATELAKEFKQVMATDISEKQLAQAVPLSNIQYQVMPAESTNFPDHTFDLITVAQALHWFNFDSFFQEIHRVLKPNGLFAAWFYTLLKVNKEIDQVISLYYSQVIGSYWPPQRKHIDHHYQGIAFPFKHIEKTDFSITFNWSIDQMIGYLNSWSSTQAYIKAHQKNPIHLIEQELRSVWGDHQQQVSFPIQLILGQYPS